jgi:hypothetical protein
MKTRKNTSSKRQKLIDIKNRAKSREINQSSTDSLKQTFSGKSKQVETKGKPSEPMFLSLDLEGAAKNISAMPSKKRKKTQATRSNSVNTTERQQSSIKHAPKNEEGFSVIPLPNLDEVSHLTDEDIAQANLDALKDVSNSLPARISQDCIPVTLFHMAQAITALAGTKLSFAIASLYVVLCNLLSRYIFVHATNLYGAIYTVEINISGLIIGEPSSNKSPAVKKVVAGVREAISQTKRIHSDKTLFELEKERIQHKHARQLLNEALKVKHSDPKKAHELENQAKLLMTQAQEIKQLKNFIISKSTEAALIRKVSKTDDPILMIHEEAGDLLKLTQKAGDTKKQLYINLMDGDSLENHENSFQEFNTSCKKLSILGAVQPEVVSKIVIAVNDGLIQRFPIIAYENNHSLDEVTLDSAQINEHYSKWKKLSVSLLSHSGECREIKPTKDAQNLLDQLRKEFDALCRDKRTNPILQGVFGKRTSFVLSISAANAFIRHKSFKNLEIIEEDIQLATAYAAINLEHFKFAFGFTELTKEKQALDLLKRIKYSKLSSEKFTASMIAKNEWSGFKKAPFVEELLEILGEYQLTYASKADSSKGGRPTVYWKINQDLLEV